MTTTGLQIRLRPYQQQAVDAIHAQLAANRSTLLVMPTGTGKTVVFSHIARDYLPRGRIMVLAHREELIGQAVRKLKDITGCEPDVEMGEWHACTSGPWQARVIVATIQSLVAGRKGRMHKFNPDDFSLLIFDEAHHCPAPSYQRIDSYFSQNAHLRIVGATGTPDRADERALGMTFKTVAFEMDVLDTINDGWVVPIEQHSVYVQGLDYSSVRTTAGDLNGADLARVLEFEAPLHGMASPIIDLVGDRQMLVFAASLGQAERLTEIFNRHRPGSARWVHGATPKEDRRTLFREYGAGAFQYLVNVAVAIEGYDQPEIQVVAMCRPTKSRALYAQMVGRGIRPLPDLVDDIDDAEGRKRAIAQSPKPHLEVIDFVGNAGRHRLVTSADILGGRYSDDIIDRAKRNAERKSAGAGKPVDVIDELEAAEREIEREEREAAEAAHRERLRIRAEYSTAKVNPFSVFGVEPWRERAWHKGRPPTEKQIAVLERNGVDVSGLSFTHASQLIDTIVKNRNEGRCTYKQAKTLRRFGYDPAEVTFQRASELITTIAANGWRRPA